MTDMKKALIYIIGVATALVGCSEEITYQLPDNVTDEVQFTVGNVLSGEAAASRAESHTGPHTIQYDPDKHPDKLGVFAYYNNKVNAVKLESDPIVVNSIYTWKSDLYWPEVSDQTSIDFIGYMYDTNLPGDAAITKEDGNYKLSFTASLKKPVLFDVTGDYSVDKAPLVCCNPINVKTKVAQVNFNMDRTLAGYSVWFQLGEKMDNVRDFIVKEVGIYGSAYQSGKVNVVYKSDKTKEITWDLTGSSTQNFGTAVDPLKLVWETNSTPNTLPVNTHTEYKKWGNESDPASQAFFAIPSITFNPTIKVKYDVVLNGPDNSVITRKDVISNIEFNSTNFSGYDAAGEPGKVHPIKIKIVPSYLYVLADKDQASGYIVIQ